MIGLRQQQCQKDKQNTEKFIGINIMSRHSRRLE